ncbi:MAG: hypothetical protein M1827_007627 [Pycnora praestabilis]|nr:MAG: hypothetical protein M1827_007627 [Pycnora praestabilis]
MAPKSRVRGAHRRGCGARSLGVARVNQSDGKEEVNDIISLDGESDASSVVITGRKNKAGLGFAKPTQRERIAGGSKGGLESLPDVYQDMLVEAVSSSPSRFNEEGRPLKRRRTGKYQGKEKSEESRAVNNRLKDLLSTDGDVNSDSNTEGSELESRRSVPQRAYDESEDSADSDANWEEVDLNQEQKGIDTMSEGVNTDDGEELNLVLNGGQSNEKGHTRMQRKPITAIEKKMRLEVHKMHLLSLLAHVHLRNHWCNDVEVQAALKSLLSKRTISYLNPGTDKSQFQGSRSFMDGLAQASDVWRLKFQVNARGMKRAVWADSAEVLEKFKMPEDIDSPIEKPDFRALAGKQEGSRDVGAQLFCSLLRSAGVTARLVCSLQPLPFTTAGKGATTQRPKPQYIYAESDTHIHTSDEDGGVDVQAADPNFSGSGEPGNSISPLVPKRAKRLGQPVFRDSSSVNAGKAPVVEQPRRRRIRESPYPVYWVEAFNAAVQKWVSVDPHVTSTIAKPSKFEPPGSDSDNAMSYVIAFEEDGNFKDVTRRYARAYNAKTRKARIEVTKGGERWWRKVLRVFSRGWRLDRDQVEDSELAAKEASEEMPRNVQDFKDHPYYALERHLRRNEVIHPKREVGKVTTGKSATNADGKTLEPIFRRRDVNMVKSADGWYRLGREIKPGEQPLKRAASRRNRGRSIDEEENMGSNDEERAGIGLYAEFQTDTYEAPPVVRGRVPRNAYGNLDIYVPSMIPKGGVHLQYPEAAKAALVVGVDFADAVTGFEFKGRHGTAVVRGIIVAAEYQEAVEAVIRGFQDERAAAEEAQRSFEALRMWRRFLAGLRIIERIDGYNIEGERDTVEKEMEKADDEMDGDEGGGGFLPDKDQEAFAEPTAGKFHKQDAVSDAEEGGGFLAEDVDGDAEDAMRDAEKLERLQSNNANMARDQFNPPEETNDDLSGGFIPSEEDYDAESDRFGGGFMPDKDEHDEQPNDIRGGLIPNQDACKETVADLSGGFIPDDYEHNQQAKQPGAEEHENGSSKRKLSTKSFQAAIESNAGGFIIEQNPDALPAGNETSGVSERSATEAPGHGETNIKDIIPEDSKIDIMTPKVWEEHDRRQSNSISEDDERGSLLSHDPDDEDADPEWLVDID